MTRSKLNLITDGLMLLCMAAIAGIALLIKFVLVPGYQRREIYGRNVELLFCGLGRHRWGTVHLYIGLILIALLVLHIVLHWASIVAIFCKVIPNPLTRKVVAVALILVTALLLAFPYFVRPKVLDGPPGSRGLRTCEAPQYQARIDSR
ncbi:MAG: hypothetical protein CEE38_12730 [Planctomycetes bacterium B3_Pla]|nr:MAG: hypothetical protein CEE38_12730 [Planctomycetes bacterium B3_Pla]